jgi:hypothetical protein
VSAERRRAAPTLVVGVLVLALVGCGSDAPAPGAGSRSSSPSSPSSATSATSSPTGVPTLTAITLPPPPPATGRLLADLRQSSRDVALGRMEVWLGNDTVRGVTPTAIRYRDPRFHGPVAGERLRLDPSRSERGYPLPLPRRPACGVPASAPGARPTVTVAYTVARRPGTRRVTLPVGDDNDVVARYAAARCLELAVARVAPLSFEDTVPVSADGQTGTLTLVARPRGHRGHVLRVDTVAGTPLFSAAGRSAWAPHARVSGAGPPTRIRLPVQPARCDDHVFMEAAGATAFLVGLRLDGRPGELVVRMSPAGTSAAISFARSACGL